MASTIIMDTMLLIEPSSDVTSLAPLQGEPQWEWLPVQFGSWFTILEMLSAVAGIVGNLLVMAVIFGRKHPRTSTDTLIGSLAVADFLTSVFLIPIPVASRVPSTWLGEIYCKVIFTSRPLFTFISASVLTLTAISVERFTAVTYPFRVRILFSHGRTVFAIIVVWAIAFIMNSFAFFVFFVDGETATCGISFPTKYGGEILGITSFFMILVIPACIMIFSQSWSAYVLHRESKRFLHGGKADVSSSHPSVRLIAAKKRVIKLIFIVNIIFIVCWAPDQAAFLAYNLGLLPPSYLHSPVDNVLVVLAFYNSCANPIIYTLQHARFRTALKNMLLCSEAPKIPIFGLKYEGIDVKTEPSMLTQSRQVNDVSISITNTA